MNLTFVYYENIFLIYIKFINRQYLEWEKKKRVICHMFLSTFFFNYFLIRKKEWCWETKLNMKLSYIYRDLEIQKQIEVDKKK